MATKKRKVLEKVVVTEERVHWSEFLTDTYSFCEVPANIARCATPEIAWRAASGDQLDTLLGAAHIKYPTRWGEMSEVELARAIRKRWPKPPAKIMRALKKWLNDK